jgi:Na+-driven multidrug efflux pump
MKVIMAVYALNTVFIAKLWHSVGEPWNLGNGAGARAALRRMVLSTAGFCVLMGIVIVVAIDPIVSAFTRNAVQINDPWFVAMAVLYTSARAVTDAVAIAIFATRHQHRTVATVATHGLINIPFSIVGCIALGLPGIMLAQFLSLLITSGWRFPLIFMQVTKDRT